MQFCQSLEPVDDARRSSFPGKALEWVSIHSHDTCGLRWVAILMPAQTDKSLINLFDSFELYLCTELLR